MVGFSFHPYADTTPLEHGAMKMSRGLRGKCSSRGNRRGERGKDPCRCYSATGGLFVNVKVGFFGGAGVRRVPFRGAIARKDPSATGGFAARSSGEGIGVADDEVSDIISNLLPI